MRRLKSACALVSTLALVAACGEQTSAPEDAPLTPASPEIAPVSYACESGRAVSVAYPDPATARLSYDGQAYALDAAPASSGARYVGGGLEWRTEGGDGTEAGTLSRLGAGAAVLERCSRPAVGSVLVAKSRETEMLPCRASQIRLSNEGGDAGAGNRVINIGLRNVGDQPCSLTGYPTVTLEDARGRALTAVRAVQATGSYFTPGQPPAPVLLAPEARAAFELAWSVIPHEDQGEQACPTARRVRVTPPADSAAATLDLELVPCGGRVQVSPMRELAGAPRPAPEPTG